MVLELLISNLCLELLGVVVQSTLPHLLIERPLIVSFGLFGIISLFTHSPLLHLRLLIKNGFPLINDSIIVWRVVLLISLS